MPITYPDEIHARINASIEAFWLDETGEQPGILQRDRIFDFFNRLIGARAYNQGLADAQAYLQAKLLDMEADLAKDIRLPPLENRAGD